MNDRPEKSQWEKFRNTIIGFVGLTVMVLVMIFCVIVVVWATGEMIEVATS